MRWSRILSQWKNVNRRIYKSYEYKSGVGFFSAVFLFLCIHMLYIYVLALKSNNLHTNEKDLIMYNLKWPKKCILARLISC